MPVIECEACRTSNTLDSKFCRQCGHAMPVDAVDAAKTEVLALVSDGRRLLADGRIAEALMIAESALEFDHDLVEGLALYGDCRERQERFTEAAESYERIVELRPDSPLDRIRLGHLRKLAQQQQIQVAEPRQKRQLLYLSGAVAVVLVSVGFALSLSNSSKPTVDKRNLVASNFDSGMSAFDTVAQTPEAAGKDLRQPAATGDQQKSPDQPLGNYAVEDASPRFGGSRLAPPTGLAPISPNVPTGLLDPGRLAIQPTEGPKGATPQTPTAASTGETGGESAVPPKKEVDNSVVDIRASQNSGRTETSDAAAQNLVRVARDLYLQGKFDRAADAYQKALKAGASKGSTNQRLAQCYEKLEKTEDAIAAYKRAIQAFEAQQLKQPDQRTERALAACKKALAILGG
ncbi:MAG: tetratricopeptide repeat protein [Armatimonadetes bacterium]|nr:tetratricopeptide repeat protein [Armatimonadota bacterium]